MSQLLPSLVSTWQLVVKRSLAHWRVLSSVIFGVLLASTMMASTTIYFDTLRELALRHALNNEDANRLDILATTDSRETSAQEYERVSSAVQQQAEQRLSWLLKAGVAAGRTPTLYLTRSGDEDFAGQDDRRAYFAFAPRLEQYTTLLPGGRMPLARPTHAPGEPLQLEVVVPVEAAELLGVSVGDILSAVPAQETALPYVSVLISGVFQRNDTEDGFWYLYERALQSGNVGTVQTIPFFVSTDTYLGVLGPAFGNLTSTYAWLLDVDTERLDATNTQLAASDIALAQQGVNAAIGGYGISTSLFKVFDEYDTRLFFIKPPMLMFLILVVMVVLYYVITLSSLLIDQQRGEIVLLRSRGAATRQILTVFVLEGATIAILAALAGPLLAAGAISLLGFAPAFAELNGSTLLPVRISFGAYEMSALGGLLSFAALMIPAVQASRVGVIAHRLRTARPSSTPFFHRYYLDVLLLLAGIMLLRQLRAQGSVLVTDVFGEIAQNQLLAAVPGIMLVAVAMILLRLFPSVMNIASRLSSRWLPVGLVLGLWQLARDPTHYARLSLLLILTAGLGVFASSFVRTLERSFEERVLYSSGSDIRVEGIEFDASGFRPELVTGYEKNQAIDHASPFYRGNGFDVARPQAEFFTILGVDEESFRDVAWIRDDFSKKPLMDLLHSLRQTTLPEGIQLPDNATSIGVSLKAAEPAPDLRVYARIKDANDRYFSYQLGQLGDTDILGNVKKPDWLHLQSSLDSLPSTAEPLTLVSLGVNAPFRRGRLPRGSVLIDEITATTSRPVRDQPGTETGSQIIDSFDDISGWNVLRLSADALPDDLRSSDISKTGDSGSAFFSWAEGAPMSTHGIFFGTQDSSLPVLASESFISDMGYRLGDELLVSVDGRGIRVRLEDTIDFFPTVNPFRKQFLVADLTSLVRYANLDPAGDEFQPNEVWLSTNVNGNERVQLVERLAHEPFEARFVHDRAKRMMESQVDPLTKAGWSALLFIAFSAVLMTSGVGFLVHAYVSVRNREAQFALMRTIGFSMKQVVALVWLESAVVITSGMALGTWMGGRLSTVIMPFLGHDDRGSQVVPPFVIGINWVNLSITYAAMAIVFAIIISGVILFIWRISPRNLLRMGE